MLALFEKQYADYGPTLASEKLHERHRIEIHRNPEVMAAQARLPYKQRKARPHRQWRPRRSCFGEMVQMDGSHHDWLEGRGPKLVLMGYIDDATSTVEAGFMIMRAQCRLRSLELGSALRDSRGVYLETHDLSITPSATVEEQLEGLERSQASFRGDE